jgi:Zn-dependent protease
MVDGNYDNNVPVINNIGSTLLRAIMIKSSKTLLFNLLPFGVLDGEKIFYWNKIGWGLTMASPMST